MIVTLTQSNPIAWLVKDCAVVILKKKIVVLDLFNYHFWQSPLQDPWLQHLLFAANQCPLPSITATVTLLSLWMPAAHKTGVIMIYSRSIESWGLIDMMRSWGLGRCIHKEGWIYCMQTTLMVSIAKAKSGPGLASSQNCYSLIVSE